MSHYSHGNGFFPVCAFWCHIRWNLVGKTFVPLITWKWLLLGINTLMCFKIISLKKLLPYWSHEIIFSPMCTLWCFLMLNLCNSQTLITWQEMISPQCVSWNIFYAHYCLWKSHHTDCIGMVSSVCGFRWLIRLMFWV